MTAPTPEALRAVPVTHEQALEAVKRFVSGHFGNGERPRIGIPARPDYDDDLMLVRYVHEQSQRDAEVARLREALNEIAHRDSVPTWFQQPNGPPKFGREYLICGAMARAALAAPSGEQRSDAGGEGGG